MDHEITSRTVARATQDYLGGKRAPGNTITIRCDVENAEGEQIVAATARKMPTDELWTVHVVKGADLQMAGTSSTPFAAVCTALIGVCASLHERQEGAIADEIANAAIARARAATGQTGGARMWALIGTFAIHAVLIGCAALGGLPEGLAHHSPIEIERQECITDSECMELCPADAECDGGPQS